MVAGEWEEEMVSAGEWCELMVEPSGRFVRSFLLTVIRRKQRQDGMKI